MRKLLTKETVAAFFSEEEREELDKTLYGQGLPVVRDGERVIYWHVGPELYRPIGRPFSKQEKE